MRSISVPTESQLLLFRFTDPRARAGKAVVCVHCMHARRTHARATRDSSQRSVASYCQTCSHTIWLLLLLHRTGLISVSLRSYRRDRSRTRALTDQNVRDGAHLGEKEPSFWGGLLCPSRRPPPSPPCRTTKNGFQQLSDQASDTHRERVIS